ncbi:MAG TPA: hypothetical protein DCO89_00125 [Clostridiales bacterium]|nr:hypothetical protein [Clostridiales bacterium]
MWFEKATQEKNKEVFLFDNFFDRFGLYNIKVESEKNINGMKTYVVSAFSHARENNKHKFYVNDFSVMTEDIGRSSDLVNNLTTDMHWGFMLSLSLNKEDRKTYIKEFKDYHHKLLENEIDMLKSF